MHPIGLSRRSFLASLGALTLASPFVRGLRGVAHASELGRASRLIVFFTPNGTIHNHLRPTGGERSFAFPAGSILEPLEPHKAKIVLVDGINFFGVSNHEGGMASMLTGAPGGATDGMSVDQYVAAQMASDAPFSSLELGVLSTPWGVSNQTVMCYGSGGRMIPPDDDPRSVYRRVFGAAAGSEETADTRLLRRQSILDVSLSELADLRALVGTEEGRKLDAHMDAIRTVERRLQGPAEVDCSSPPTVGELDKWANANFPVIGRSQTDLLVAAMQCGATQVGTLQWSHTVGPPVFSWVDEVPIREQHHSLSHWDPGSPDLIAQYVACERWFTRQFVYLLERLDALPEPGADGTMLDHSLVVWAQELGDGRLHECVDVPFVLAGGAGGALETGRYLRYDRQPHQKLLVSICRLMGLPTEIFGTAAHGTGGLEGIA